jgi:segregation and condensation protein A
MPEAYEIKLENFTGPIDLLLHLIRINKMDIFSLDLHAITRQYLEVVTGEQAASLENSYYFLLMASTLLEIKSKLLLPQRDDDRKSGEPTGEEMKADLVRRLQTYKNLKDIVADLTARGEEQKKLLSPELHGRLDRTVVYSLKDVSLYDLLTAFEDIAGRARPTSEVSYGDEDLSVDEVYEEVVARIKLHGAASLTDILTMRPSLYWAVLSFLTVLELINAGNLTFTREGGGFSLAYTETPADAEPTQPSAPSAP